MSLEIQITIIGIIGTLGGTILGWLLNNFSQKGRLNIYLSKWEDEFLYNEMGCMVLSSSLEQTESYNYKVSLDLYNSSRDTKIMRDVHIIYANDKKLLFDDIPKDDFTKRVSHPMVIYDEISVVNIPAKSVVQLNLHGGVWKEKKADIVDWDFVTKSNRMILRYTDEKNRVKNIVIRKCNYKNFFNENKIGEVVDNSDK